nr:AAA family ATPase [Colletotrichum truncatum]XP_036575124.1 AAA family ATPase [Colletotrichum truncatum]KAF6781404.1 AAA family ATPase [Colletotrichum truncatum]KAF6781645.1 AAA family ATPase [Colletotrichum truncatum]
MNLKLLPMRFLSTQEQHEIRCRLIARGKKYCALSIASHRFMHYNGPIALTATSNARFLGEITSNKDQSSRNLATSQRVIIDRKAEKEIRSLFENFDLMAPSLKEYLGYSPHGSDIHDNEVTFEPTHDDDIPLVSIIDSSSDSDLDAEQIAQKYREETRKRNMVWDGDQFTDNDYLMCPPTLIAFLLKHKVWAFRIYISGLEEITWKEDPFLSLQLPEEKKRLVKSLVQGFGLDKDDFHLESYEDIIEGKGKGLVFLLHGPPGLGKTLTAESVAESTHRPLYHVSTGELSTNVEIIEKQLTEIFRLGLRWGAVVLLDEADVLMTKRTTAELERNAVVAVFLRLIEYYDGMLFLTTNRFDDFDNAFYNRIHVSLRYYPLQSSERTNIWRQHITRATQRPRNHNEYSQWSEETFQLLGQIETNGRDIRNFTRTAYGYALALGEDLSISHVMTVIRNNLNVDDSSKLVQSLNELEALQLR